MDCHFLIGILHFFIAFFVSVYGIFISKNIFDYIYIYYSFIVILSWASCNGECLVTYLIKVNKNKNYISGSDIFDNDDMYICPSFLSNYTTNLLISSMTFVWIFSIFIVLKRNHFPNILIFSHVITWFIYKFLIITFSEHHNNLEFQYYQRIIFYLLLIQLFFIIYYTKLNLTKK